MTTPPENAPGSAAGSPNHLGWHGQWLQAAAECLGVAPRSVSLARNRGAAAQGSRDGDDSAASALFGDEPTGEPFPRQGRAVKWRQRSVVARGHTRFG